MSVSFQISGRRTDYSLTIMMLSDTSTEKVIPSRPGIPAEIAWPESEQTSGTLENGGIVYKMTTIKNNPRPRKDNRKTEEAI